MSNNAVTDAIQAFLAMANASPSIPVHDGDKYCYFTADKPGARFTRIVMHYTHGGGGSVHAFVDNQTGDLLKAAGWKAPAKGVRGNIVTALDQVAARFDWAGSYLYLR